MNTHAAIGCAIAALVVVVQVAAAQTEQSAGRRLSRPGAPAPLVVEGEALAPKATANAGTIGAQPMDRFGQGWSGGAQLLWTGGATGAVLDLPIAVPASATYMLELHFTRAPDYGQVQFQLDSMPASATVDAFASRVAPPAPVQAGPFRLTAGAHTLSLKLVGKHAQSSGMRLGLDLVKLYPSAAIDPGRSADGAGAQAAAPASQSAGVTQPEVRPAEEAAGAVRPLRGAQPLADSARVPVQPVQSSGAPAAAGGRASSQPRGPGPECDSTCLGDTSSVYRKVESGSCRLWFRIPCNPYTCDAALGACRDTCASDQDCAQGAKCDTSTGLCAPMSAACADNQALRLANGQTVSCSPYACRGDACMSACSVPSDCAVGHVCNGVTGRCTKKP